MIAGFWRMMRLIVRPCPTLDIVPVITDTEVFIEDSAVSTVKGVLFSILVTEMINLKCQFVQTSYELIVLPNRKKSPSSVL